MVRTALSLGLTLALVACGGSGASDVTPGQVADAFRASGVEIGEVTEMAVEDYGMAPMADEGLRFTIPSLGDDSGGRIMRYDLQDDLERAKAFYDELGEQSAALFSHTFTRHPRSGERTTPTGTGRYA